MTHSALVGMLLFSTLAASPASMAVSSSRGETPPGLYGKPLAHSSSGSQFGDLAWIRESTASSAGSAVDSEKGSKNRFNTDKRFSALLRASFPQHQYFWRDHGVFTPLAELVHTFIGVPGKAVLQQQRYAVFDRCVPHACSARGMVWVDTESRGRPELIFVATDSVNGSAAAPESLVHLWMFSSVKLNWGQLPPTFIEAVSQWWAATLKAWERYTTEKVVMVSLVEPSGRITALSPVLFRLDRAH